MIVSVSVFYSSFLQMLSTAGVVSNSSSLSLSF
uniref:Uncharacterized protein n=1 Tax=Arundo donax TaxID=35708 RepID=A0A0A8Y0Z1_ARUDO